MGLLHVVHSPVAFFEDRASYSVSLWSLWIAGACVIVDATTATLVSSRASELVLNVVESDVPGGILMAFSLLAAVLLSSLKLFAMCVGVWIFATLFAHGLSSLRKVVGLSCFAFLPYLVFLAGQLIVVAVYWNPVLEVENPRLEDVEYAIGRISSSSLFQSVSLIGAYVLLAVAALHAVVLRVLGASLGAASVAGAVLGVVFAVAPWVAERVLG